MRKRLFIILLVLFFLITISCNIVKAKNYRTIINPEFKKEMFVNYRSHFFTHKISDSQNYTLNQKEDKSTMDVIIKIIEFAKNIFLVIFFTIWSFITIKRSIHNRRIKNKYKMKNNRYEIKRDKNEGGEKERHSIYLVEKNSKDKKLYHHIMSSYTYGKLGYLRPSRKDEDCFDSSEENYTRGEDIVFYNITFDYKNIDT